MLQHRLTRFPRSLVLSAIVLAFAGGTSCAQPAPAPAQAQAQGGLGRSGPDCVDDGPPQTGLPRERLTFHTARGPVRFDVQVAADDPTRQKGLMFVRSMPDDQGMIFDFHTPQRTAFWMHNTYIPLDLIFVDAQGRIANIAHKAATCSDAPIPGEGLIRAVIEVNAGVAERLGIQPGDRVTGERIFPAR